MTMSRYQDYSAAELAAELDQIRRTPATNAPTGWVSMLDEATLSYVITMPGSPIAQAQKAFSTARMRHMDSLKSSADLDDTKAWAGLGNAAHTLAEILRPLGDHVIEHCTKRSGWGECGLPLRDGVCNSEFHVTEEADSE